MRPWLHCFGDTAISILKWSLIFHWRSGVKTAVTEAGHTVHGKKSPIALFCVSWTFPYQKQQEWQNDACKDLCTERNQLMDGWKETLGLDEVLCEIFTCVFYEHFIYIQAASQLSKSMFLSKEVLSWFFILPAACTAHFTFLTHAHTLCRCKLMLTQSCRMSTLVVFLFMYSNCVNMWLAYFKSLYFEKSILAPIAHYSNRKTKTRTSLERFHGTQIFPVHWGMKSEPESCTG